jgi:recombination protein RecT
MANEIAKTNNNQVSTKVSFTNFMTSNLMKAKVNEILGDEKKAARFTSSIVSAVNNNPQLRECDNMSILSGALLGDSLNLSPSPQLGNYYLVPFKDKDRGMVATFQMGYKGYIQLAIRSGQYKKLNVLAIKEGELIKYDPLNEEIEVQLIEDEEQRENAKTIGYYAMFEYTNGFKKTLYWSKKKMEKHALQYSKGYQAKKGYTFWEKDFDAMAYKTMLRQLISKWGIMSIEMQNALESDMAVINEDGTKEYFDNSEDFDIPSSQPTQEANVVKEKQEINYRKFILRSSFKLWF